MRSPRQRGWQWCARRTGLFCLAVLLNLGTLAQDAPPADPAIAAQPSDGAPAASGASTGDDFEFPPEVEALLNQGSDPESYGEAERCIFTREIRNTEILDEQHLVFELSAKRFYLVQFPYRCSGMRRGASLVYQSQNGRLCKLDQIRAFEPGPAIPNPPCTMPGFMPVQREQVALLRASLKAKRKAEQDAYKAQKAEKAEQKKQAKEAAAETAEPVSG